MWKPTERDINIIKSLTSADRRELLSIFKSMGSEDEIVHVSEKTGISPKRIIFLVKKIQGIGLPALKGRAVYYHTPDQISLSKIMPGVKRDRGGKSSYRAALIYIGPPGL